MIAKQKNYSQWHHNDVITPCNIVSQPIEGSLIKSKLSLYSVTKLLEQSGWEHILLTLWDCILSYLVEGIVKSLASQHWPPWNSNLLAGKLIQESYDFFLLWITTWIISVRWRSDIGC